MNRKEMQIKTFNHHKRMKELFKDETDESYKASSVVVQTWSFKIGRKLFKGVGDKSIFLLKKDSVSAAKAMSNALVGRIGILNFASFKNPVGGFLKGSITQEESLCHSSNLYEILERYQDHYNERKIHMNKTGKMKN